MDLLGASRHTIHQVQSVCITYFQALGLTLTNPLKSIDVFRELPGMELTYRGATYTAPSTTAEVFETKKEGIFLGAYFKIRQSHPSRVHRRSYQLPIQLTYRGVHYTR